MELITGKTLKLTTGLIAFSVLSKAEPADQDLEEAIIEPLIDAQEAPEKRKKGLSLLPIVAANSTFGVMVGGAAVHYFPGAHYHKTVFMTIFTTSGNYFSILEYWRKSKDWILGTNLGLSNFFTPYYRETREVRKKPSDRIVMRTWQRFEPYLGYRMTRRLSSRVFFGYEQRVEGGKRIRYDGKEEHLRTYPDEKTWVLGLRLRYDDDQENFFSQLGRRYELQIRQMPGSYATSLTDYERFTQVSIDLRRYWLLNSWFALAGRLYLGDSIGDPTPHYRFKLGGSNVLRGYGESRFRGQRFYSSQLEGRYPIWGIVSGNTFLEVADITSDNRFGKPLMSYGTGLRIGLPPDYVAKVRFDFGFSPEGLNFSMQAEQAF